MTNEQLKYIQNDPGFYLLKAKKVIQGRPSYVCPKCGNGSGADGTGMTSKDGIHWHCFVCGLNGDIVDIIAEVEGLEKGSKAAFDRAAEIYNVTSEDMERNPQRVDKPKAEAVPYDPAKEEQVKQYFQRVTADDAYNEDAISYLQARGFESFKWVQKYGVGYDSNTRAIIFPYYNLSGGLGYVRRFIDKGTNEENRTMNTNGSGFTWLERAIQNEVVFVCEGGFDALSINCLMGGGAVSLNSIANVKNFAGSIKRTGAKCRTFILCLDNDEAGKRATNELAGLLIAKGFNVVSFGLPDKYKDINEMFAADREGLRKLLTEARSKAYADPFNKEFESHKVKELYPQFLEYVADDKNNRPIKTGFDELDKAIGGGLIPSLYIVGGGTSIGKTTFVLQVSDNAAKAGNDVIIFSMEMAKENIIARSISRETYQICRESGQKTNFAKTEYGVLIGYNYQNYNEREKDLIERAGVRYLEYAGERISIYDGRKTADEIKQVVTRHIELTGVRPVVVVDYLQMIAPNKDMAGTSDKTQTDYSIAKLIEIKRDLKCPVIAVSSFSRSNYTKAINEAAFKDSGEIEYNADCAIALSLVIDQMRKGSNTAIENDTIEKINEAKAKVPREIRLTLLKNRGNQSGKQLYFLYNPLFNHFEYDWKRGIINGE